MRCPVRILLNLNSYESEIHVNLGKIVSSHGKDLIQYVINELQYPRVVSRDQELRTLAIKILRLLKLGLYAAVYNTFLPLDTPTSALS